MITALLIILVLIEFAKLVIRYIQAVRFNGVHKNYYCSTTTVDNVCACIRSDRIIQTLDQYGKDGFELVSAIRDDSMGREHFYLFFTKKKLKNFKE